MAICSRDELFSYINECKIKKKADILKLKLVFLWNKILAYVYQNVWCHIVEFVYYFEYVDMQK